MLKKKKEKKESGVNVQFSFEKILRYKDNKKKVEWIDKDNDLKVYSRFVNVSDTLFPFAFRSHMTYHKGCYSEKIFFNCKYIEPNRQYLKVYEEINEHRDALAYLYTHPPSPLK